MLSDEHINYAENSYPSNHSYKIKARKLKPTCKLQLRYRKIKKLYPEPLTSLLDISCSKGFFVFSASEHTDCQRSLGIDINDYDVNFCQHLKSYLERDKVDFVKLRLHELAARIDDFGGPFQTVLLVNAYQYFYFGSDLSPECYPDHEVIFSYLNKICSQRVIFNNRVNLADCQNKKHINAQQKAAEHYSKEKIQQAAKQYFTVTEHGFIGRYPLWTMDK